MRKIRTQAKYKPNKKNWEQGGGISETIQNDVLSIGEMLKRLSMGMPLSNQRHGIFSQEDEDNHDVYDLEKLRDSDIIERQEVIQEQIDFKQSLEENEPNNKVKEEEPLEAKQELKEQDSEQEEIVPNQE